MRSLVRNDSPQTLLLAGNWNWEVYEAALAAGFRACEWDVFPFDTRKYTHAGAVGRIEAALRSGPGIDQLNRALVERALELRPAVILLNRCDAVRASTLRTIKKLLPEAVVLVYHNDNPFVGAGSAFKYRHYLASIRVADATLVYRPSDIPQAKRRGARRVELVPPYYVSYLHRRDDTTSIAGRFDVVYAGHYENDGRERLLNAVAQSGARVLVCGVGWERIRHAYRWAEDLDVSPRLGESYVAALSSAKIGLGLLSTKNRDVYTRRCFEIPACGTLLMAPRTSQLQRYFEHNREAVFFDSTEDLVRNVHRYLADETARHTVADAGHNRCTSEGNDEVARARQVIRLIESITSKGGLA